MKLDIRHLALTAICVALNACGGGGGDGGAIRPTPQPVPPPASGTIGDGRLGELVEWARATHGLPAMGVVIVADGQVAESAAEGRRSASASERVTAGDRWHLGSLTKGFTATLAGVLVEQSVLSWDTRPLDVWPELDTTIQPAFRNITLRHLLSHTAGVRRADTVPSKYGDLAAGTIVEKRRAFAAELLADAPVAAVGTESYSNGGYVVVAAMMETLMSASWESLMTDFVFAPLDMRDSGFGAPGTPGEFDQPWGHWDLGVNYDPVSPGPDADNPQALGPAGSVHATMADYAKFMIAHIDGDNGIGGVVSAQTFEMLHTPVDNGSALGWGVRPSEAWPGLTELVHAGSNLRWYSIVLLIPELNGGALFVVNAGGDFSDVAIGALADLLVERFDNSR